MTTTQDASRFRKVFANRHAVLPVIHVTDLSQAMRNTAIARGAGADGVFLINHFIRSEELLHIHAKAVEAFPGWWIGLNCLDFEAVTVFSHVTPQVSGIWADNAMIREGQEEQPEADSVLRAQAAIMWEGLYFGGVAFKCQRQVSDLSSAAQVARRYMDVVTTSGPGTGIAADIEKIRMMKAALGDFPLAVASGITPENVRDYLPYSDCYLVASGISKDFEELDPARVRSLVDAVRAYDCECG